MAASFDIAERLQKSTILTGATASDSLVSTSTGQTVIVFGITICCDGTLDVDSVLSIYQSISDTESILLIPFSGTKAKQAEIRQTFEPPLRLGLFKDLKYIWSSPATITGNVCITIDYIIIG